MKTTWTILTLFFAMLSMAAHAQPETDFSGNTATEPTGHVERVGGNYTVSKIERQEAGGFRIEFQSEVKEGPFQTLILESDHVNVGVAIGQKLRLSAEVTGVAGSKAEVSQVLLFLPNIRGTMPVWMLSKRGGGDLKAGRYLEMHAPLADYQIL